MCCLPPLNSDTIDTERRRTKHGAINSDAMKAYLITTGTLCGILALAHIARTVAELRRLTTDVGFLLEGPGIGIVAGALSVWAWRLLRRAARS
jgi:hypothetical protein